MVKGLDSWKELGWGFRNITRPPLPHLLTWSSSYEAFLLVPKCVLQRHCCINLLVSWQTSLHLLSHAVNWGTIPMRGIQLAIRHASVIFHHMLAETVQTHRVASTMELWTTLSDAQALLVYHHVPVIFCQMLAFDWWRCFWPLSLQLVLVLVLRRTMDAHKWRSDLITGRSLSHSAKCWPLIGWKVSDHYLHNHSLYNCFHIGIMKCQPLIDQRVSYNYGIS